MFEKMFNFLKILGKQGGGESLCSRGTEAYVKTFLDAKASKDFIGAANDAIILKPEDPMLLAYYLTQFHETDINNENFGKGFTEWTNVAKARPQYTGHYQPHIPMDVGFYDLAHPDVMYRQVELARQYGIGGFCFYYYWFQGRRVLEKPLFNWLKHKDIDFPYCLFWANESWESRWFGGSRKTIIEDCFDLTMAERFFEDILPFFKDERYIKINNKPFLIVYRPDRFSPEELRKLTDKFNALAVRHGFDGVHFCIQGYRLKNEYVKECGVCGTCEFPPYGTDVEKIKDSGEWINPEYQGKMLNIKKFLREQRWKYETDYLCYKGCFPAWDNTPRNFINSRIYKDMTPQLYKEWLTELIRWTREHNSPENRIIFINAWNEWGEGAHLEPDLKYGYAYLMATRAAIEESRREI